MVGNFTGHHTNHAKHHAGNEGGIRIGEGEGAGQGKGGWCVPQACVILTCEWWLGDELVGRGWLYLNS